MVVVVGRVVGPCLAHTVVDVDLLQEVGIGREEAFLLVVQTIESHILQGARATGGGKGVGLGGLQGNLTPLCLSHRACTTHGHSALIELLTVAQDVLANLAKVEVEVATQAGTTLLLYLISIYKGVHQPELDILDVSLFEVVGVELAHHTAPMVGRIVETTIVAHIGAEIIRTALLGIEGQVHDGQRIGSAAIG